MKTLEPDEGQQTETSMPETDDSYKNIWRETKKDT
jgi:hypothetical protein